MPQSLFIFVTGLGGVFLGMACLYISIRMTAFLIGRWTDREDKA